MRRFWISLSVLIALFCVTLYNTHYLDDLTGELAGLLLEAETCVVDGDWDAASDKTEAALDLWKSRENYLHMVLRHADTDAILLDFQEVRQLIDHQEDGGEYSAVNARLVTRIRLLHEMEQFNLKNLL
ncbi:MAG: DUF4363 family protein [Oscillospiraceae bacterium]